MLTRSAPIALLAVFLAAAGVCEARAADAHVPGSAGLDNGWSAWRAGNYGEALTWFHRAADQGSPEAKDKIGEMYELAQGVPEDMGEAMKWFRKAADEGYPPAQMDVAALYSNGWGVPRDEAAALAWNRKAADQGYPVAEEAVGVAYANGLGVPPDFAAARPWLERAIAGGDTQAELFLCPPDQQVWAKAVATGDPDAMDKAIIGIDPDCPDLLQSAKAYRSSLGTRPKRLPSGPTPH